jgi:hypothetical protein
VEKKEKIRERLKRPWRVYLENSHMPIYRVQKNGYFHPLRVTGGHDD